MVGWESQGDGLKSTGPLKQQANLTYLFVCALASSGPAPLLGPLNTTVTMVNPVFSAHTELSEAVYDRFMRLPQGPKIQAEYICGWSIAATL